MLSVFGHCWYCAHGQAPIVQLYVIESALTDYAANYARCWFFIPEEQSDCIVELSSKTHFSSILAGRTCTRLIQGVVHKRWHDGVDLAASEL